MKSEKFQISESTRMVIEERLLHPGNEALADLWKECPDRDALFLEVLSDAWPDLAEIENLLRNLG